MGARLKQNLLLIILSETEMNRADGEELRKIFMYGCSTDEKRSVIERENKITRKTTVTFINITEFIN